MCFTSRSTAIRLRRLAIALRILCVTALVAIFPFGASAQSPDLQALDLEGLMNLRVTSVSKREQSLSRTGAAVFVITQDDIRRSGMNNIPDLLRMAPGVEVARINAHTWAISVRGFNDRYSNKVLVLVDGRTIFDPAFSGVYWDEQSLPLEDIERIEIIRGPGGTVWGANAVNGVINIITKNTKDTLGGLISVSTGSTDSATGVMQFGGTAGTKGAYRVYGRSFRVENSRYGDGRQAADGWHGSQAGFRSDWNLSARDKLTVQGDISGTSEGQTITTLFSNRLPEEYTLNDKVRVGVGNLLGRWNHIFSDGSDSTLQVYYDRVRRFDAGMEVRNTGDFDFQYHFHEGSRNDVVVGAGYRLVDESVTGGYAISFGSGNQRSNLLSTFIQDEVKLTNSLSLTIGSKFEHNVYTGFEYEPSVQLVWTPTDRQTVWASASKAIQQPAWDYANSRLDYAAFPVSGGGFAVYQVIGTSGIKAAQLIDYELGYRTSLSRRLAFDATGFLSNYRRLQTLEPRTPYYTLVPGPPHLVIPNVWENLGQARTYGLEMTMHLEVTNRWRLNPGFTYLQTQYSLDKSSHDPFLGSASGNSPKRQAQLQSTMNLPHRLEWDATAFYVGSLRSGPVPSYVRLDTRLGWMVGESVEISIAGQNLLSPRHPEFLNTYQVAPTSAERSVIGKVTWHF